MDILFDVSGNKVQETSMKFQRYLLKSLPTDQRLVFIRGARGTGKTTMLLQYLKQSGFSMQEAVYLSLDDIVFSTIELIAFVDKFYKSGGKLLVLDEVHKYPNWSREIKTIYDRYANLRIMVTCSSALILTEGEADLSRRSVSYQLNELSLREYVELKHGILLPTFTLDDVLKNHVELSGTVVSKIKPIMVFNEYLKYGAYPFFMEGENYYAAKLSQVIKLVLESDLAAIDNIAYGTIMKLRKLLGIIAEIVPFKPNIAELSVKVGVARDQLLKLLYLLEKASVIYQLRDNSFGMSYLSKPEKIYLHNPNIAEAITHVQTNSGTNRETFFINQVSEKHSVNYSKIGDFVVNNQTVFEIGGINKKRKQVQQIENAYIVKDDIEFGNDRTIPLWLFGFLY